MYPTIKHNIIDSNGYKTKILKFLLSYLIILNEIGPDYKNGYLIKLIRLKNVNVAVSFTLKANLLQCWC